MVLLLATFLVLELAHCKNAHSSCPSVQMSPEGEDTEAIALGPHILKHSGIFAKLCDSCKIFHLSKIVHSMQRHHILDQREKHIQIGSTAPHLTVLGAASRLP